MRSIAFVLLMAALAASCDTSSDKTTDGGIDSGPPDYTIPEPEVEEPPPLVECELEWSRSYELPDVTWSSARGMTILPNGNYFVVGSAFIPNEGGPGLMMELSAGDGDLVWYGLHGDNWAYRFAGHVADKGIMLFGWSTDPAGYHCVIDFLSEDYEVVWSTGEEFFSCRHVVQRDGGSFLFAGAVDGVDYFSEIDTNGQLNYSTYPDAGIGYFEALTQLDGELTAFTSIESEDEYPYSCTPKLGFTSNTDLIEVITYKVEHSTAFSQVARAGDSNLLLSGGSSPYPGIFLMLVQADGVPIWTRCVGPSWTYSPQDLIHDESGHLFASYTPDRRAYAGRLDPDGHLAWHTVYQEPGVDLVVWAAHKDEAEDALVIFGGYGAFAWVAKLNLDDTCY
jgi:hypothetical protein